MSSQHFSNSSGLTIPPALFWGLLLTSLAVRLYAVIVSPLEPSVDEAQYWLWGQTPQLGYYSKPPLIAWILAGTSSLFDAQTGAQLISLRIAAPLLHLLTAVFIWQTGRLLFSDNAGRLAALLWVSLPAVGLGSFVMSTDTPMLVFWSAGLYCLFRTDEAVYPNYGWVALAGLCVGLAILAKYAGLYFILSFIFWLIFSCFGKPSQKLKLFSIFCAAALITSSPTWLWNYSNDFVTLIHLSENANIARDGPEQSRNLFSLLSHGSFEGVASFWRDQFAVFGPITLFLLIFTLNRLGHGARYNSLHLFIWPVLVIMTGLAFLNEANANWAVVAYPASALLVGQLIANSRSRFIAFLGRTALLVNLLLCGVLAVATAHGGLGPLAPASDPLRHLRGWSDLAQMTETQAQRTGARTIIAFDRQSAALLHWYLQNTDVEIVLPRFGPGQGNHYHRVYPLSISAPRPLLALTEHNQPPTNLPVATEWRGPTARYDFQISKRDRRQIWFWQSD